MMETVPTTVRVRRGLSSRSRRRRFKLRMVHCCDCTKLGTFYSVKEHLRLGWRYVDKVADRVVCSNCARRRREDRLKERIKIHLTREDQARLARARINGETYLGRSGAPGVPYLDSDGWWYIFCGRCTTGDKWSAMLMKITMGRLRAEGWRRRRGEGWICWKCVAFEDPKEVERVSAEVQRYLHGTAAAEPA